jgi:ABC-type glycerol-3-phosphate transport system substrate-binding protein
VHQINFRIRAALLGLLFALGACALAPSTGPPPAPLVLWVATPAIAASLQQRINSFMHDHPNLTVQVFNQSGKIKNGDISIAIEALNGSALAPDVVALTDSDFRLMSNRGDLLNLGPYVIQQSDFDTGDFFPASLDAFSDKGKQMAIPSEIVPWMVYYNKDLFAKANVTPPASTWRASEFVADAQQVKAGYVGKQDIAGFVTDPTAALLPVIETFGVQPPDAVDDPYVHWLDDKRTAAAAQWFADLTLRQGIMPNDTSNQSLGLWFSGRAAMAAMFMDQRNMLPPYMLRDIQETPTAIASPTPPPGWKFSWGVSMFPTAEVQTTVYYVSGYAIPQSSQDPDNAWLLIDYLTRHLPDRPGRAYVPARESLAFSNDFALLYPETGREAYLQSVLLGHRVPAFPPSVALNQDDIRGMLDGTTRPSTSLQAYRDRIQPILTQPAPPPAAAPPPGS